MEPFSIPNPLDFTQKMKRRMLEGERTADINLPADPFQGRDPELPKPATPQTSLLELIKTLFGLTVPVEEATKMIPGQNLTKPQRRRIS